MSTIGSQSRMTYRNRDHENAQAADLGRGSGDSGEMRTGGGSPVILRLVARAEPTGATRLSFSPACVIASSPQDSLRWNVGKKRSRGEGPSRMDARSFAGTSGPQGSGAAAGRGGSAEGRFVARPMHPARRGIQPTLNEDQRGLATRYLPMAESLARAFEARQAFERDELRSTAYMALVEAARTFDPYRNVNFATFARHRIRGALRDYARFLLSENWRGSHAVRPSFQVLAANAEQHGRVLGIRREKPVGARDRVDGGLGAVVPAPAGNACARLPADLRGSQEPRRGDPASGLLQGACLEDAHGSARLADRRVRTSAQTEDECDARE